ncbi:MAG: hypothetical protein GWO24_10915, partial [Akkermansiaceae bacterium]|nr:hypothetical protein [Akkermansiaceae bacterium]
ALRVGKTRFVDYLRRFGFTEKTEILLSGEQAGKLTDPGNDVNYSRMSYGYGVSVTPLQVACAYAAIANDGMRMKPRVVQSLLSNDGALVREYPPEGAQRVVSVKTARQMRAALETVMGPNATGRRGNVPGY